MTNEERIKEFQAGREKKRESGAVMGTESQAGMPDYPQICNVCGFGRVTAGGLSGTA